MQIEKAMALVEELKKESKPAREAFFALCRQHGLLDEKGVRQTKPKRKQAKRIRRARVPSAMVPAVQKLKSWVKDRPSLNGYGLALLACYAIMQVGASPFTTSSAIAVARGASSLEKSTIQYYLSRLRVDKLLKYNNAQRKNSLTEAGVQRAKQLLDEK